MANKGDGWILISIGGGLYNHPNHKEWMIDNASRLSDGTQPDDPGAPGSIALLAGRSNVWQLDMNNVWVQYVSSGGSGGNSGSVTFSFTDDLELVASSSTIKLELANEQKEG